MNDNDEKTKLVHRIKNFTRLYTAVTLRSVPYTRPQRPIMFAFLAHNPTPFRTSQCSTLLAACCRTRSIAHDNQSHPAKRPIIPCTGTATTSQTKHSSHLPSLLESGLSVVVLKPGKQRLFRDLGNPMVYGGAVDRCIAQNNGNINPFDIVAVLDADMQCVGYGFYNEKSMFRVRLLHHGHVQLPWDYAAEIRAKVANAVKLRALLGLPSTDTNTYRIINGEGDRLSGLVVDRVGPSLVVSSSAMWCEICRNHITVSLQQEFPRYDLIWRQNVDRLKQDGVIIETIDQKTHQQDQHDSIVTDVVECGVRYRVTRHALTRGQKTGHYADQRENRNYLRQVVSQGGAKRVLDLFCYTGGFGLNAALGGATVTGVDSSRAAVDMARANAKLNGVEERMEFLQEDVMDFLRHCNEQYDVVVLDPPKYAPTAKSLTKAVRKYRRLNELAFKRIRPGGLLISCSCSGAMTRERGLFVETVREAARAAGREITLVKMSGAAADHVVAVEMMESEYLSVGVFAVR